MIGKNAFEALLCGFLIALVAILIENYFGLSKMSLFYGISLTFLIVNFGLLFFIGVPGKFQGTVVVSIIILFIGYLLYGPYYHFLYPIFTQAGKTIEEVPTKTQKVFRCVAILFTNPLEYQKECQYLFTEPPKTPEPPGALEVRRYVVSPTKLYPGGIVQIFLELENTGDFDAKEVKYEVISENYANCELPVFDMSKKQEGELEDIKKKYIKSVKVQGIVNNPWGEYVNGNLINFEGVDCENKTVKNVTIKYENINVGSLSFEKCRVECKEEKLKNLFCEGWECNANNKKCSKKIVCKFLKNKIVGTGIVGIKYSYDYATESYTYLTLLKHSFNPQKEISDLGETQTSFIKDCPVAVILNSLKYLAEDIVGGNETKITISIKNRRKGNAMFRKDKDYIEIGLLNPENSKYVDFSCEGKKKSKYLDCEVLENGNNRKFVRLRFKENVTLEKEDDLPGIYQITLKMHDLDKEEQTITLVASATYRYEEEFTYAISVKRPLE